MIDRKIMFRILCLMLLPVLGTAQNLTGIWRGSFYSPADLMMGGSKYRYEVQIANKGRDCKGVTYSYQTTRFYGKASLVGVWSAGTKNMVLQENKMLDLKIVGGGDGCLMTCYLTYRKEGDKEYLEGTYTSANMHNDSINCGGGKVMLEKVPESDFELEDFLKPGYKPGTTAKVKPGQEDYLVKKPAPKPPVTTQKKLPPSKPPVSKPPVVTQKPAVKPNTTQGTTAKKPPVSTQKPTTPKPANPANSTAKTQPKPATPTTIRQLPPAAMAKPDSANPPVVSKPSTEKPVIAIKPLPLPPPVLKERKNELFRTITTNSKNITISFYDNGEIDGDTISVYNNNRLIASRKGLTAKPIVLKIELDESEPIQDIVMVAENLGSIPPNTALMIVQAGKQRYTLNLSSTEQKNAMVRFKYDPE